MDLSNIPRELHTRDLYIRPSTIEDADGLFAMLSDSESMEYWSDPPINHIDEAIRVLQEDIDSDAKGNSMCWSIILNGQDKMVGKCILFNYSQKNYRAEIGYIINRDYWRRGFAQQALEALIGFAFNTLELHRIEADVDPENAGSLGILEKLGFEREGLFRDRWYLSGKWVDSVMLGLLNR